MTQPLAGWYPDPQAPGARVRWWDGAQWTAHTQAVFTGPRSDDGEPLAGWWQRVGQLMIDVILVQLVALPATIPLQIEIQSRMQPLVDRMNAQTVAGQPPDFGAFWSSYVDAVGPLLVLSALIGFIAFCTYGAVCLRWKGRTVGMKALNIRVRTVEPSEGPLPWGVIVRRLLGQQGASLFLMLPGTGFFVGAAISSVWGLLDVLWASWDRRNQTLHDKIAGTLVVRRG